MTERYRRMETKLVHAGEPEPRIEGAVAMPIFQSSTFLFEEGVGYHDIRYLRLNNTPNHLALHRKLAALEGGEAALVTSSGMSAISTALLAVLDSGDHLLAQSRLYGGTHDLITKDFPHLKIGLDFIDGDRPETWEAKLRPNTKAVYCEAITNPVLEVADLEALAAFARRHGLVSLIDNTFASPVNFRPLEHGFTLSLHSATKYLNGHTDVVAGALIGPEELVRRITLRLNHLGGCLDTHACYLLHRGLKTLALRVARQNSNAQALAEFLESHPAVAAVNYPGLPGSPYHERAARLFDGCGGMLSFEPRGGAEAARRFVGAVRVAINAPSLGGVETLVSMPARVSHSGLTDEERAAAGVSPALVRVSVGIEAADDLIEDFDRALR